MRKTVDHAFLSVLHSMNSSSTIRCRSCMMEENLGEKKEKKKMTTKWVFLEISQARLDKSHCAFQTHTHIYKEK